jgi:hypothetical protein
MREPKLTCVTFDTRVTSDRLWLGCLVACPGGWGAVLGGGGRFPPISLCLLSAAARLSAQATLTRHNGSVAAFVFDRAVLP